MKLWMRKLFVVFVTILTFGTIIPQIPVDLDNNVKENSDVSDQNDQQLMVSDDHELISEEEDSWNTRAHTIEDKEELVSSFTAYSVDQAEQLSMMKFGQTISNVIGDEFKHVILPKIEDAIAALALEIEDEDLRQLVISEKPAGGLAEKIFHVYHRQTGQDLIRFHVRRDRPPKEGYWFNFHYHTYVDNFQTHHDMGSIYWAKNTPPHWMSV